MKYVFDVKHDKPVKKQLHSLFLVVVSNVFTQSSGVRRGTAFDMAVEPPYPLP